MINEQQIKAPTGKRKPKPPQLPDVHNGPVYTYHSNLPGFNPEHAFKLLLLWKQAWAKQGFTPIVLNENHARRHELYQFFDRRIETLPTINKLAYERACWLRYCAMAVVGGGIMTDADCLPYAFVPELTRRPSTIHLLQNHIPSVCIGSAEAYHEVVKQMIDYKVTEKDIEEGTQQPHVSDMYMFYRNGIKYTKELLVKNYGDEGWEQAPLVHFSHSSMKKITEPRHLAIPKLRAI